MSDTVWVVEQGNYSDYHVVGVYTSKENANAAAALVNLGAGYDAEGLDADGSEGYERATVVEWPLNPGMDQINQGLLYFDVSMHRDGSTESIYHHGFDPRDLGEQVFKAEIYDRTKSPHPGDRGLPNVLCISTWAKDQEHAIKIANERRVQMIASNEWPA